MSKLIAKIPSMAQGIVASSRPKLNKFLYYAKVELVPPTPAEVGEAVKGFQQILNSAKTGKWKQLTVRIIFYF
ncbi:ATP synthase subunit g, mitochondrial [Armadillidium vulgare]|nr:ATP synthase subunit g, mitochondrial [Armadillidium vulgare]